MPSFILRNIDIRVNNIDYVLTPTRDAVFDCLRIRAIETGSMQTDTIVYYLYDKVNHQQISLLSINDGQKDVYRTAISDALNAEIESVNIGLRELGIDISALWEVLFPGDVSTISEIPTLTSEVNLFEEDTIAYLKASESFISETDIVKRHLNENVITFKNLFIWDAIDLIVPLVHSANWDSLLINQNLKGPVPLEWQNHYGLTGGGNIANQGYKLKGNAPGAFINLGFQPFKESSSKYFPNHRFTKNSASITFKINSSVSQTGTVLRRGMYQDVFAYNATNHQILVNICGGNYIGDVEVYSYNGSLNGIWTLNRISSTQFEVWKDGVLLHTANSPSDDFVSEAGYSSFGYGAGNDNALEANYQFACLGRALTHPEVVSLHTQISNFITHITS